MYHFNAGAKALNSYRVYLEGDKETLPFLMDDAQCRGTEPILKKCPYLPDCQIRSCYTNEVAGVRCRPSKLEKRTSEWN